MIDRLREDLETRAFALGFDAFGISPVTALEGEPAQRLRSFLDAGYHGEMDWMAETATRRADPRQLMPTAQSVIMLGMSYGPEADPMLALGEQSKAAISVYAKRRDYHDVLKGRLKEIAGLVARRAGGDVKVFVDTAPLMEKPLAQAAGLGWQGKHTNLVSRAHGSWLFLGAILAEAKLPPDALMEDHCGSCRNCLDVCPTDAFPAPYKLDARRCIAYLTIEYGGHIAPEFRKPIGNRVFGCDDCLAVCPWNKFANTVRQTKLAVRIEIDNPALAELLALDDAQFRQLFSGTPVKRAGRDRFLRNCLIAAGNSGDAKLLSQVRDLLVDPSPLVRAMAVWALGELADGETFRALRSKLEPAEADPDVLMEWHRRIEEEGASS
ncbi:MAG: tRNA epoxyqueuosine(34) reductase QueG [Filomicrobium sp.]